MVDEKDAERKAIVEKMQHEIDALNAQMKQGFADRDAEIDRLKKKIKDLEEELAKIKSDKQISDSDKDKEIADLKNQIAELKKQLAERDS